MNELMNKRSKKDIKPDGGNEGIRWLNLNKECGIYLCEMYDENWPEILPSKYQEIGCSSLSFDYTCKIRDGTELE